MADILVFGNPLLDISTNVEHEYLEKYGLSLNNAILAEEKHMPIYEEIVKGKVDYIAGGAALNTARVAQWLLPANSVAYIGCIGSDETGGILKKAAEGAGVHTYFLVDEKQPTGRCAVLLGHKERSLVTSLGAANHYKLEHFQSPAIQAVLERAKYYYSTGYFITVSPESLLELGKHAAAHNKPFFYNLSAPFVIQFFYDKLAKVLEYVDVLFSNESEARTIGEKLGLGDDLAKIAEHVAGLPKANTKRGRIVVFTQGAESTIVYTDGKATAYPTPKVPSNEIVDTNGAGDSFAAGFIAAYSQGKSIAKAVEAGNYAAGTVIRHSGCAFPPTHSFTF
jgi:adenosine kinase